MQTKLWINDIYLPKTGKNDEFIDKFNNCTDLFQRIWEEGIDGKEQKKRWEDYVSYKYCLEQGII